MAKPLELQIETRTETHPTTGEIVEVTEFRRGLLITEQRTFQDPMTAFMELASQSPRKCLEEACDNIRNFLEARSLPSDRQPRWVQFNDEDWKQMTAKKFERAHPGQRIRHARWISRLRDLTEPVSPERYAGDLLWILTDLLGRPGIEEHLWHITRFAHLNARFEMSSINHLAHLGAAGRNARASGPKARRSKAIRIAEIVAACTSELWTTRPELRGIASRTAEVIASDVNTRLQSEHLLARSKARLSAKTIGDYIRKNNGV